MPPKAAIVAYLLLGTQPHKVTCRPSWSARRSPHVCERIEDATPLRRGRQAPARAAKEALLASILCDRPSWRAYHHTHDMKTEGRRVPCRAPRSLPVPYLLFILVALYLSCSLPQPCSTPKISIVLPVYNGLPFLRQALLGLDGQANNDFELVIVDDGSNYDTEVFLRFWASSRPFAHLTRLARNGGLPAALNVGHRAARGQYITWLSADNMHFQNMTGVLARALDLYPECDLVIGDHIRIDAQGNTLSEHVLHKAPTFRTVVKGNPGIAAFMYRRGCYEKVGPYREDLQGVEDWEMWGRMLSTCGRAVYVPSPLMGYRVHADRLTERLKGHMPKLEDQARRSMWKFSGGAGALLRGAVFARNDPEMAQEWLGQAADTLAKQCGATASCLTVVTEILARCMAYRTRTVRSLQCASNLLVATAMNGISSLEEREEIHRYALFLYDTLTATSELPAFHVFEFLIGFDPRQPSNSTWLQIPADAYVKRTDAVAAAAYTAPLPLRRPTLAVITSRSPTSSHDHFAVFERLHKPTADVDVVHMDGSTAAETPGYRTLLVTADTAALNGTLLSQADAVVVPRRDLVQPAVSAGAALEAVFVVDTHDAHTLLVVHKWLYTLAAHRETHGH